MHVWETGNNCINYQEYIVCSVNEHLTLQIKIFNLDFVPPFLFFYKEREMIPTEDGEIAQDVSSPVFTNEEGTVMN